MENYDSDDKAYMDLPAGVIAHYFALMAWNGMSSKDAIKEARSKTYYELDKMTNANGSIMTALKEVIKQLFVGFTTDSMEEVVRGDVDENGTDYLRSIGGEIFENNMEGDTFFFKILDINKAIHDEWVMTNAKKYNRDQDKEDKRLYQHLPQELIGIDEVCKYFLFMAPLFDKFGLPLGEMKEEPYGAFECNDTIKYAYNKKVKKYLADNHIDSEESLKKFLKDIVNNYDAIKPENAAKGQVKDAQARIEYMTDNIRIDKLASQIISKNEKVFGVIVSINNL